MLLNALRGALNKIKSILENKICMSVVDTVDTVESNFEKRVFVRSERQWNKR